MVGLLLLFYQDVFFHRASDLEYCQIEMQPCLVLSPNI